MTGFDVCTCRAHSLIYDLLQAFPKFAYLWRVLFHRLAVAIFAVIVILLSLCFAFQAFHHDLCLCIFFDTLCKEGVTYLNKHAVPHVMENNQHPEHGDLDIVDARIDNVGRELISLAHRHPFPEHWHLQQCPRESIQTQIAPRSKQDKIRAQHHKDMICVNRCF